MHIRYAEQRHSMQRTVEVNTAARGCRLPDKASDRDNNTYAIRVPLCQRPLAMHALTASKFPFHCYAGNIYTAVCERARVTGAEKPTAQLSGLHDWHRWLVLYSFSAV
eukprot:6181619-Pleurochrysis_carterae.AAC.1